MGKRGVLVLQSCLLFPPSLIVKLAAIRFSGNPGVRVLFHFFKTAQRQCPRQTDDNHQALRGAAGGQEGARPRTPVPAWTPLDPLCLGATHETKPPPLARPFPFRL